MAVLKHNINKIQNFKVFLYHTISWKYTVSLYEDRPSHCSLSYPIVMMCCSPVVLCVGDDYINVYTHNIIYH